LGLKVFRIVPVFSVKRFAFFRIFSGVSSFYSPFLIALPEVFAFFLGGFLLAFRTKFAKLLDHSPDFR